MKKIEKILLSIKNNLKKNEHKKITRRKLSKKKQGRKLKISLNDGFKEIGKDLKKKFSNTFTDVDELAKFGLGASVLLGTTFRGIKRKSMINLRKEYYKENQAYFELKEKYLKTQNIALDDINEKLIDLEKRIIHHKKEICKDLTEKKKAAILEKD